MNNLIERAEALLRSKCICFTTKVEELKDTTWTYILIDSTPESDFSLYLETYSNGDANLGAHRRNATGWDSLFSSPNEPEDFDSIAALEDKVMRDLELLVSSPVRIHRTRGMFFIDSEAEIIANAKTSVLYGASGLHWSPPWHKDLGKTITFQGRALTKDG